MYTLNPIELIIIYLAWENVVDLDSIHVKRTLRSSGVMKGYQTQSFPLPK